VGTGPPDGGRGTHSDGEAHVETVTRKDASGLSGEGARVMTGVVAHEDGRPGMGVSPEQPESVRHTNHVSVVNSSSKRACQPSLPNLMM